MTCLLLLVYRNQKTLIYEYFQIMNLLGHIPVVVMLFLWRTGTGIKQMGVRIVFLSVIRDKKIDNLISGSLP